MQHDFGLRECFEPYGLTTLVLSPQLAVNLDVCYTARHIVNKGQVYDHKNVVLRCESVFSNIFSP